MLITKALGQTSVYGTNELKDAARTSTALRVLSEHGRVLDAAGSDEHVQQLRRWGPQHLLQEFQRCRDNIVVPVLRVVKSQLVHLWREWTAPY